MVATSSIFFHSFIIPYWHNLHSYSYYSQSTYSPNNKIQQKPIIHTNIPLNTNTNKIHNWIHIIALLSSKRPVSLAPTKWQVRGEGGPYESHTFELSAEEFHLSWSPSRRSHHPKRAWVRTEAGRAPLLSYLIEDPLCVCLISSYAHTHDSSVIVEHHS